MIQAMETDPTIGVAGPTIYYHSAPDMIWSAGGKIDWAHGYHANAWIERGGQIPVW